MTTCTSVTYRNSNIFPSSQISYFQANRSLIFERVTAYNFESTVVSPNLVSFSKFANVELSTVSESTESGNNIFSIPSKTYKLADLIQKLNEKLIFTNIAIKVKVFN